MSTLPQLSSRSKITAAVEDLYRVFSAPAPPIIEGCPCCIDTRGVDTLLTTPLRELSGDNLWRYISGAYLTVGGDIDFRYLLPRIFELAALAPFEIPDAEIVLDKLSRARWNTWATNERVVVRQFVDAWFDFALERDLESIVEDTSCNHAESVLCGAAYAKIPMTQLLLRLFEARNAPILDDLRERYPHSLSGFWKDVPDGFEELSTILAQGSA